MKLHRLELQGFGPFLERQRVDFDAFDDEGIFLISGRTGAGKSSILDGVSFALYGSVPRYENGEKRIRSDHSAPDDPTEVSLEFTTDDRRFIVTRSPDYDKPKKRGEGLTPVAHAARLDERIDGEWVTLAAKPREVGHLLGDILGLSQQQFLQVILLAQNRFAQFLLAKNDERQALLRTLFGSRVYGDYEAALERRRKQSELDVARDGDSVQMLLSEADLLIAEHRIGPEPASGDAVHGDAMNGDGVEAAPAVTPSPGADPGVRIAAVQRAVERADYRVDTLERERSAADDAHVAAGTAHAARVALREKQNDRAASREALAVREAAAAGIGDERAVLARAERAETLRAPIDAAERAALADRFAALAVQDAADQWRAAGEHDDPDAAALRERIDSLSGELSLLAEAAAVERELDEIQAELFAEREREREVTSRRDDLLERQAALPERYAAIDVELAPLADSAVAAEAARAASATAAERLAAGQDAAEKAERARDAEAHHVASSEGLERAVAAVTALLRRRLAGYAGELAAELVDGEPCAVCGSREHPAPAAHGDAPVTEEAIADAERAREAAGRRERAAATAAAAARAAHAEAAGRSGGDSVTVLEAVAEAARATMEAAEAADDRRTALVSERESVAAEEAVLVRDLADLTARIAEVRQSCAVLADRVTSASAIVARARGDAESVAERVRHATDLRRLAHALADALDESARRRTAADEAQTDRDEQVAASDFLDAADAASALLDAVTRAEIAERVRAHEVALHSARERLRELELELAGIPDEPVDVDESAAALGEAKERVRAATEEATRAREAATRLRALVTRAEAAHAASAERAAEHEIIAGLAAAISGRNPSRMDLETFVLAAELEEIVAAANLRLGEMSSGRYLLQHTDAVAARGAASGLGIEIIDAFTGRSRPAQSLSGGESFLASLALALGLAEVVTARAGGVTLDTLFIDEGFGSLDDDTLELAMRTLDELRQGGRTVGLISHVAAMKDQLPAQLIVEATPQGPSIIRQGVEV